MGKYCKLGRRKASGWERLLCRYLCEKKIVHFHRPYKVKLFLANGKTITYEPDIQIGGNIIIEPHGIIDKQFIEKITTFHRECPTMKIILITKNDHIPQIPNEAYDEIIPIEYFDMLGTVLKKMRRKQH
jgi:hypothetical protein